MKLRIQMKDPDGVHDGVREAAGQSVQAIQNITEDERDELCEARDKEITKRLAKWFTYAEYVTIEIDTEAMTATVVERKT